MVISDQAAAIRNYRDSNIRLMQERDEARAEIERARDATVKALREATEARANGKYWLDRYKEVALVKQEPVAAPQPEPTIYERARKRAGVFSIEPCLFGIRDCADCKPRFAKLDEALKAELAPLLFGGLCDDGRCDYDECKLWQARPWK